MELKIEAMGGDDVTKFPYVKTKEIIEKVETLPVLPSEYLLYYYANGGCCHDWDNVSICRLCGWSRGPVRRNFHNDRVRERLLFAATEMSKKCAHIKTVKLYIGNARPEVCRECGTPVEWKKFLRVTDGEKAI